jgi:hypothetical protein
MFGTMTDPDRPRRRYGEKEVGLILKRATELQQQAPELTEGSGLTLKELEEIASEAGIDPRFLRDAAAELETHGPMPEGLERWLGGPVLVELERRVPGEIPEDDWDDVIHEIGRAAGGQGHPSVIGRTLSWVLSDPNRQRYLQVTLTSKGGETVIRIEERMQQLAGALFGGIVGGGGLGIGLGIGVGVGSAMGSTLFATAFPIGLLVGSYALARQIFGGTSRNRRRALLTLLDRLTEMVEPPKRIHGPGPKPPQPR